MTKIYKSDIVHIAFEECPKERMNMGEDLLQVYLLLFFSMSYGFISDLLYNYRVGVGISAGKKITDQKLEALAKSYNVYTYLRDWTEKQGGTEICADRLNEIKMQMLDSTASTILQRIEKEKRQWYVDLALKYCPKEEFIAYLSYLVYGNKCYREEEFSKIIKSVKLFEAKPRQVKTIGTFYHRMYNGGIAS